jgi:alcohol dehydrogenase (NADP+)
VIYDKGVTLLDTWRALERLVDEGKCKAIGLSDVGLGQTQEIFEAARIKPAVVHVESHPYLPQCCTFPDPLSFRIRDLFCR